jgi:hypothetical protein
MKNNRFQRSAKPVVFTCCVCDRRTRLSGQGNDELCLECWELAGLENHILDGGKISDIATDRNRLYAKAAKQGSDAAKIRAAFPRLWEITDHTAA